MSGSRDWNNLDRDGQGKGAERKGTDSKRNLQQMLRRRYQQSRGSPESGSNSENPSPVSFRPPVRQEVKKINISPPTGASEGPESPEANGNFFFENNFESLPQQDEVVSHKGQGQQVAKGQIQGKEISRGQRAGKGHNQGQKTGKDYSQGQMAGRGPMQSQRAGKGQSQGHFAEKGKIQGQMAAKGQKAQKKTGDGQFDDALNSVIGEISSGGSQGARSRQSGQGDRSRQSGQGDRSRQSGQGDRSRQSGQGDKPVIFENNFDDTDQSAGRSGGLFQPAPQGNYLPRPFNMNKSQEQFEKDKKKRLEKLRRAREIKLDPNDPMTQLVRQLMPDRNDPIPGTENEDEVSENKDEDGDEIMEDKPKLKPFIRPQQPPDNLGEDDVVLKALQQQGEGDNKGEESIGQLLQQIGLGKDKGVDPLAQMMNSVGNILGNNGEGEEGKEGQEEGVLGQQGGEDILGRIGRGGQGGLRQLGGGGANPLSQLMQGLGGRGGRQGGRGRPPVIGGGQAPQPDIQGGRDGMEMGQEGPDPMAKMMDMVNRGQNSRQGEDGSLDPVAHMMGMLGGGAGGGADHMSQMMGMMGGGRGGGGGADPMSQMMGMMGGGGGANPMAQMMGLLGGGRGGGGGMDPMSQMMALMGGGRGGGGGADPMSQMMGMMGGGRGGGGGADPMAQMMGMMGGGRGGGGGADPMAQMMGMMGGGRGGGGRGPGMRGRGQAGHQEGDEEIDIENASLDDQLQQLLGFENLKAQSNRSPISKGMCTVIIIDTSGSMLGDPITEAGQFIAQFLNGLEEVQFEYGLEENVAVICAGREVHVIQHLTTDYSAVRQAVDTVYADGPSPLHLGLMLPVSVLVLDPQKGRDFIADTNGHRISPRVIFISDGHPSNNEDTPGQSAVADQTESLQTQGICVELVQFVRERTLCELYCVPVGDSNMTFLSHLCESVGGSIKEPTDAKRMSRTYLHHFVVGNLQNSGHDVTNKETVARVVQQCLACSDQDDVDSVLTILSQGEPDVQKRDMELAQQRAGDQHPGRGGGQQPQMGQQQMMQRMLQGGGGGYGGRGGVRMGGERRGGGPGRLPMMGGDGGNIEAMMQSMMGMGGGEGQGGEGKGQQGGGRGVGRGGQRRGYDPFGHEEDIQQISDAADNNRMTNAMNDQKQVANGDPNKQNPPPIDDNYQFKGWPKNPKSYVSPELIDSLRTPVTPEDSKRFYESFNAARPEKPPKSTTEEEQTQHQFDKVMEGERVGVNEPYKSSDEEDDGDEWLRKPDAAEQDSIKSMKELKKGGRDGQKPGHDVQQDFGSGATDSDWELPRSNKGHSKPSRGQDKIVYQREDRRGRTKREESGAYDGASGGAYSSPRGDTTGDLAGLGLVNIDDDDEEDEEVVGATGGVSQQYGRNHGDAQKGHATSGSRSHSRTQNRESLRELLQKRRLKKIPAPGPTYEEIRESLKRENPK